MILMIDNYDSFTYNVYQYIGSLYPQIQVVRNDEITIDEIRNLQNLEALVISPGPGYPDSAGISKEAIKTFGKEIPVLGICLGHQAIGEVYGGKVVLAKELMHGKMSEITINNKNPLFEGLEDKIYAARYHSLIIDDETFPEDLKVIGRDEKGQIMAVCHKEYPVYGIQFHPESILTEMGMRILENFLTNIAGIRLGDSKKEETMSAVNQETLKPFLTKIVEGNHLTEEEAYKAMDCIMSGNATDAQMGSFLTGLRMNHETPEEITGFAKVMRAKAAIVPEETEAIDIVGTGGDLANSINISTTSAFVIAVAGAKVAKHGNRSVSSKSGAADVLEALGAKIGLTPEESKKWYDKLWKNTVDLFRSLDIPVRTLECCSGDLADLKVKSCDVEAWSPRQKKYFEVGSCSNLGDAQARRLKIRVKGKDGNKYFAHTLNNTVVAPPRMLIAFLENNLREDGSVAIPEVLRPYMGGKESLQPKK